MEYTHEEYCNVHVKSHYIISVGVVQTLLCFGDRSSVSSCTSYGIGECTTSKNWTVNKTFHL
jgi:hypothetical protein